MELVGIIIGLCGIAIGAYIALHLYRRAGEDLRKEAAELRKLTTLILRALEEAGLVRFNKDEKGNFVGLHISLTAASTIHTHPTVTGNLTVEKKKGD